MSELPGSYLTSLVSHSNVTILSPCCSEPLYAGTGEKVGSVLCAVRKASHREGYGWSEVTQLGCGRWEHSPRLSLLCPSPGSQRSKDRTLNAVSDGSHSTLKRRCSAVTSRVSPDTMLSGKTSSHPICILSLVFTGFIGGSASVLCSKGAGNDMATPWSHCCHCHGWTGNSGGLTATNAPVMASRKSTLTWQKQK